MKRNTFIPFAVLMLTLTIAPAVTPAHAEARAENPTVNPRVSAHLKDFKSTVYQMRTEADTLDSYMPGNQMSAQTHAMSLNRLKDHVNDLGQTLARMET